MYLTDDEIREKLSELDIYTSSPDHPFDVEEQVQPCSVDLRLSPTYWRPTRFQTKRTINLSRSQLLEMSPRRYWRQCELDRGESITLRPGEMVLGRVYERLTIPSDCAGAIEGRSSFARMGLSVHCTGGFINPGWRGHMPLTLTNSSRASLRIPAYLPVCQLMLVRLGKTPTRLYGSSTLHSKYVDDDGGPSYWWRDQIVSRVLSDLGNQRVMPDLQARLLDKIGVPPDDVLERLEHFLDVKPASTFANVDELLDAFVDREDEKRMQHKALRAIAIGSFPLMASASIGSAFVDPVGLLHYIMWGITALTVPAALYGLRADIGDYLGRKELEARRREQGTLSAASREAS